MGFLQAMQQMGLSEKKEGLEPYLVRPMDMDGKEIRVWLEVKGGIEETLDIIGVSRIDLADYDKKAPLIKYLYRKPVGSNTTWRFTPIYKAGKMKADLKKNEEIFGANNWQDDAKSHFAKIKKTILDDYEKENVFSKGSVNRILKGMEAKIDSVLPDLDNQNSHLVIFVIDANGTPLYPGGVPAFEKYFAKKLEQSLEGKAADNKKNKKPVMTQYCNLCLEEMNKGINFDKIFKFATFDKVSVLSGLDKNEIPYSFPICQDCYEQVSAGREKVDRLMTKRGVLPDILIWAIPEAVGVATERTSLFGKFLNSWSGRQDKKEIETVGEKTEEQYFSYLAKEGQGLIFHFVFWEKNNAQEILHLMVEDVPPERLAFLESSWQKTTKEYANWSKSTDLDFAIRSLYAMLNEFAGKSSGDKKVFRDLSLKVIANMLEGEKLPVDTFKQLIITRLPRLVYEGDPRKANFTMRYAEIWAEYMNRLNREVS